MVAERRVPQPQRTGQLSPGSRTDDLKVGSKTNEAKLPFVIRLFTPSCLLLFAFCQGRPVGALVWLPIENPGRRFACPGLNYHRPVGPEQLTRIAERSLQVGLRMRLPAPTELLRKAGGTPAHQPASRCFDKGDLRSVSVCRSGDQPTTERKPQIDTSRIGGTTIP